MPGMAEIKEYLDAKGKTVDDINQKFVQGWVQQKSWLKQLKSLQKNIQKVN